VVMWMGILSGAQTDVSSEMTAPVRV
jgi:hypothetical protein